MSKKAKSTEPSLLDQLNGPLKDIVEDFRENGAAVLESVRARNPEKYLELATKLLPLIVQLNPAGSDFNGCRSMPGYRHQAVAQRRHHRPHR